MSFERYYQAVAKVEGLATAARTHYLRDRAQPSIFLDRTRALLQELGNPHQELRYVHVGGTGGKGTVATAVQSMLVEGGHKAGLFTSPFATTTIEKIKVNELYCDPAEFVDLVEQIQPALQKVACTPYGTPSYFEAVLAIALLYFKQQHCQWVVLEVGLGGRYDATNIIEQPAVTAITNIDYDHTEVLGKTLMKIASEKAGIIKSGSHFFTTESRPRLRRYFRSVCQSEGAIFHAPPLSPSAGQVNYNLAAAIARHLLLPEAAIQKGWQKTLLPCRFEQMQKNPQVIVDGAHNPVKIKSVLQALRHCTYAKLYLVFAVAEDKDWRTMLDLLAPQVDQCYFTTFSVPERRCVPAEHLAEYLSYIPVKVVPNCLEAVQQAIEAAGPQDLVLVTGSFYLAGKARTRWYSEEWVLSQRRSFPVGRVDIGF